MSAKIPVCILGATGTVGQKFVRLLADHPWFEVAEVAASERSACSRVMPASSRNCSMMSTCVRSPPSSSMKFSITTSIRS